MTKTKSKSSTKKARMKVRVPGARKSVENMKYEIANEFGATTSSKCPGCKSSKSCKSKKTNNKTNKR